MGSRRRARECALQLMFEIEATQEPPEDVIPVFWQNFARKEDIRDFANELVLGCHRNLSRIDDLIGKQIENWRLERLSAVDRNILRVAVYELLTEETPRGVVINEAIEIAKRFGTTESAQFVNGILDGIVKKLSSEKAS